MGEQTLDDRRQHQRHPLATNLQFFHGPTRRDIPGRCADISAGGMLMYVPPSANVRVGHAIRIAVGSVRRPEFAGLSEEHVDATIVRVDRGQFLPTGQVGIGVRFHTTAG